MKMKLIFLVCSQYEESIPRRSEEGRGYEGEGEKEERREEGERERWRERKEEGRKESQLHTQTYAIYRHALATRVHMDATTHAVEEESMPPLRGRKKPAILLRLK